MRCLTSSLEKSRALQKRAHALIPGGCHTYAKGDDQFPECAPAFMARGSGCHAWDVDGNEYIEYGMGLRAVTLGHGFPAVVDAMCRAVLDGTNFTRPSALELECAEEFLGLIEGAEMVKFAKNGSDATGAAVRLARAYTGRDLVAVCADQPFFSVDDWFIGTTSMAAGVPEAIRSLTTSFNYNDLEGVRDLFNRYPDQIACLILEPATSVEPASDFLGALKALCTQHGALLVFDESITGFRWHLRGAQHVYRVTPDLSVFGKALANGFPLAALAGRRDVMALGGLDPERDRVFLLSYTHAADSGGLAAGLATMRCYREEDVVGTLYRQGERLRRGIEQAIALHGLQTHVAIAGRDSNLIYVTRDAQGRPSQLFRTLFMQEMIRRGVLGPSFVISFSHTDADVDQTIDVVSEALTVYRDALNDGVEHYLDGRPVRPVFPSANPSRDTERA